MPTRANHPVSSPSPPRGDTATAAAQPRRPPAPAEVRRAEERPEARLRAAEVERGLASVSACRERLEQALHVVPGDPAVVQVRMLGGRLDESAAWVKTEVARRRASNQVLQFRSQTRA